MSITVLHFELRSHEDDPETKERQRDQKVAQVASFLRVRSKRKKKKKKTPPGR